MRKFTAAHFQHHVPESKDGEELRSNQIVLGDFARTMVAFEVRCQDPVTVNLIDSDGQTVFFDHGRVVSFDGTLDGFVSVEVISARAFCYWFRGKNRWLEVPDPTPAAVAIDEPVNKPLADLVRAELQKYLARQQLDSAFASDVSVEELLDDLENGDLEFESEPDPFGLGYEERLQEFEEARRSHAEQNTGDPEGAPVAAPTGVVDPVKPAADRAGPKITT